MSTIVTGVDFLAIGTQDFERACAFYGETLGLPQTARYGTMPARSTRPGTSRSR
jgi:catechol 2,3-dioxygenase-like lactoylglutathione lyase family enzyme